MAQLKILQKTSPQLIAGVLLVVLGCVTLLSLVSSGAVSVARSSEVFFEEDLGNQTENDVIEDEEEEEEAEEEGGEEEEEEEVVEDILDSNLTARPAFADVERPTEDQLWGGTVLDSFPQDKDVSGGLDYDSLIKTMAGEFHGVRSRSEEPFCPTWPFQRMYKADARRKVRQFKFNAFFANWNDRKYGKLSESAKAYWLQWWKHHCGDYIDLSWNHIDYFTYDQDNPGTEAASNKLLESIKSKYPDFYEQISTKKAPEEIVMLFCHRNDSGGVFLGWYVRVKGAMDYSARHEVGHRAGGHTGLINYSNGKYTGITKGTNDVLCNMGYHHTNMDGFCPAWYFHTGWMNREANAFRYLQLNKTFHMTTFHNWKNDGKTHCLVAITPWTGEFVFYKVSMVGWEYDGADKDYGTYGMRNDKGKIRTWTAQCTNWDEGHLMKHSKFGVIRWITYLGHWGSKPTSNFHIRDPQTGSGAEWVDPSMGFRFTCTNLNNTWEDFNCDVTVTYDPSIHTRKEPPRIVKVETGPFTYKKGKSKNVYYSGTKDRRTDSDATLVRVHVYNPNPVSTRPFVVWAHHCKTQGGTGSADGPNSILGGATVQYNCKAPKGDLAGQEDVVTFCLGETYTRKIKFKHQD